MKCFFFVNTKIYDFHLAETFVTNSPLSISFGRFLCSQQKWNLSVRSKGPERRSGNNYDDIRQNFHWVVKKYGMWARVAKLERGVGDNSGEREEEMEKQFVIRDRKIYDFPSFSHSPPFTILLLLHSLGHRIHVHLIIMYKSRKSFSVSINCPSMPIRLMMILNTARNFLFSTRSWLLNAAAWWLLVPFHSHPLHIHVTYSTNITSWKNADE